MPRATVSTEPERVLLHSCPPDGFVSVRRMSYGELLTSQDMAYAINAGLSDAQNQDDISVDASMSRSRVMEFQFKTCVIDHNLEDAAGRKLNFGNPADCHMLDPRIGQEIDDTIMRMHRWEKTYPNSPSPSTNGSSTNVEHGMATETGTSGLLLTSL